jgi:hypothetical protein
LNPSDLLQLLFLSFSNISHNPKPTHLDPTTIKMATKNPKTEGSQDVDLLKCVIATLLKANDKTSIPWSEVARYMPGDPKPDTLRKRFDRTKKELTALGDGVVVMKSELAQVEIDQLKCVIKVLLSGAGKMSIPWPEVAGYMPGEPKPDTLRKRFDKVKKEIAALGGGEGEGESETQAEGAKVKKAPAKKKATPKAKATGKGKAKVEDAEDDAEDAIIAKIVGNSLDGDDGSYS